MSAKKVETKDPAKIEQQKIIVDAYENANNDIDVTMETLAMYNETKELSKRQVQGKLVYLKKWVKKVKKVSTVERRTKIDIIQDIQAFVGEDAENVLDGLKEAKKDALEFILNAIQKTAKAE